MGNKIEKIYEILLKEFGNQNWWPVTNKGKLKPTYKARKKLTEKQRFEICIGAILTQNTSWKNVEKAIENLNRAKLIDANKIKSIDIKKLAQLIKPAGYYNQKAKKLKVFADFFLKNNKNLEKMDLKKARQLLLSVYGVGNETADSILLYAYKKSVFVIDAYTKRIMKNFGFKFKDYNELQKIFEKNLALDVKMFNEFHALLVELAKRNCRKKPICDNCCIKNICN